MGEPISERTTVKNSNLRHPVEVVREWPDLDALGSAGARLKLDLLLLKPEGMTPEDHRSLRPQDLAVLRTMAMREDPTFGVTHQVAAIGALAERADAESLLFLADRARDRTADDRLRIAAVHALGEIGGAAVDEVVGELLAERQPSIRAQAVLALAKVGTAADVAKLERVAGEGDALVAPLARRAIDALRGRLNRG